MSEKCLNLARILERRSRKARDIKDTMNRPRIRRAALDRIARYAAATLACVTLTAAIATTCTHASERLWFAGVNLAGAEFGGARLPGKINQDYFYPNAADIDYFLNRGANAIRLPFRWERLQRNLGAEFDSKELEQLDRTVTYITGKGAYIILDPHNYGKYFGRVIGSKQVPLSAFSSFWADLAGHFKDNQRVVFGLMNEPERFLAADWRNVAEAAIVAIRARGAENLILVPGTNWSGAHSWTNERGGSSNASALRDLTDPAGNMAFEVHQYLDSNFSGTSSNCQSETIGKDSLVAFTRWLRENEHRGFLGEFGASAIPVCLRALDQMLQYLADNSDVWIGWTYWAAGAGWGNFPFSVHPSPEGDRPQMKILMKYFDVH